MEAASSPWGVRLEKVGRAIVVTPSGPLDDLEAERLREVLDSRHGNYASVVLDLRDLDGVGEAGLTVLLAQQAWAREQGIELAVVTGPAARASLERIDAAQELTVVEDIDVVLAPHRPTPG